MGSLFGESSAPYRDSLLPAQEWGFLLRFQVDEPCVVEDLPLGRLIGKWIQLFLDRGRT
jgi:hypothetical protein